MTTYYWNDWYLAWGWVLWAGMFFLLISSVWNWSYSYGVNNKYKIIAEKDKDPLDYLKERLARGEVDENEYQKIKKEISKD